jgi:PAS domain S-box-containing protein
MAAESGINFLQASEAEFRSLAEAMPQIVWVTRADGWNIYFNQRWVEYTGLALEESYGHGWSKPFHPEDRQRAWDAWQQAVATGWTYALECRLRRADGAYRWWLIRGVPQRDEAGNIIKWFGTCTDIDDLKRAETALREKESLLSIAGRTARLGGWSVDRGADTVRWSDEVCAIHGMPPGTRPGLEQALDFYAPEWHTTIRTAFEACMREGTPFDLELEIITAGGRRVWVRSIGHAEYDAAGAITRVQGAFQDITEKKQAEAEARRLAERLTTTLESITDAFFTLDREWRFTYLNREAERLLDRKRDDLLGRNVWEEFSEAVGSTFYDEYHRALRENCTVEFEEFYPPLNTWFEVHAYPSEEGLAVYFRDVNERRMVREVLRESEERYRAILETTNDVVVMIGSDNLIRYVNAAVQPTFGYRPEELTGKPIALLQPEHLREGHRLGLKRYLETGERKLRWQGTQAEALHRDGRVFPVEIAFSALQMAGEYLFIGFIRDITERVRAEHMRESLEAQLRESQKMQAIGTLAGGIAHDFNNIVGAILGNAELAREDAGANPQLLKSLEEIRKAGHRARELVQQILAFSRRQPASRRVIALSSAVEESVRLLHATLPSRVSIDYSCADDVPAVLADPTQIGQVMLNLGANAAYAMDGQPGRITIEVQCVVLDEAAARAHPDLRAGRYARIAVSDTGHGMDAATLRRIFEPFFTTKPVGEGTGLGLPVAHGIMSAHDGAITVSSEPGKGSRFDLYFPGTQETAAAVVVEPAAETRPAEAAPDAGRGRHILYIDDEEGLVLLVKRMLERRGYRVSGYTDAGAALEALRAAPAGFDLVVSDYNMPGMSGLDVARNIRDIRADLPVVIASGYVTEELQSQAARVGVRELIFKANAVEDFCEVVQRLLLSPGR